MTRIGKVTLTVNNLNAVSAFYQRLGLHLLSETPENVILGAAEPFLELRADPHARRAGPNEPGLYHTAFVLPAREDLGSWLNFASAAQIQLTGAADHLVSEALYLDDPEGNGIEIYVDRPRSVWPWENGHLLMANKRIDFASLTKNAPTWQGFPQASTIGHVHLRAGAIPQAEAFYATRLGFPITVRMPSASFYGADGYHHHLATNIWESAAAPPRNFPSTGLANLEIYGAPAIPEGGQTIDDPWGTQITLKAKN